jgi:TetR/AcrR family transcriptional repressor of nem operon
MRRSREDTARTREAIVESASRLFRARGVDAVSVADVMGSLGLTVGGFYKHFESKEALAAEAIDQAAVESTGSMEGVELAVLLDQYLSEGHRADIEHGCPIAALCSEITHQGAAPRAAFNGAIEGLLDAVGRAVKRGSKKARAEILFSASVLVGALVLARATTDDALAGAILASAREGLRERHGLDRR